MSRKSKALELFGKGLKPSDPEVKKLGLKPKSTYLYFQEYKKMGASVGPGNGKNPAPSFEGLLQTKMTIPKAPPIEESFLAGEATYMRLIPITVNVALTPTMLNARTVAVKELGFGADIPWDDFFDTCLFHLFKNWGFTLRGYYKDGDYDKDGEDKDSTKSASEDRSRNGEMTTLALDPPTMKLAETLAVVLTKVADVRKKMGGHSN